MCIFYQKSRNYWKGSKNFAKKNDFLIISRLHVDLSPSTAVGKFRFDIFHQQCVKARTTPANILIFFVSLTQFSIHSKGHDLEWKEIHEGPNICCFLWEKYISIYASGRSPKMTASFSIWTALYPIWHWESRSLWTKISYTITSEICLK